MSKLEELEQLKKEYQEIPIPEHGTEGVKVAIERAKQKKRRSRRLFGYVAGVAAAVLLVAVLPKDGFMMKSANESANLGFDVMMKDFSGGAAPECAEDGMHTEKADTTVSAVTPGRVGTEYSLEEAKGESVLLHRDAIEEEIRRQLVLLFPADKSIAEGFLGIPEEQEYYINEEGQLILVFAPGEIAPEAYGELKFVIPENVWK